MTLTAASLAFLLDSRGCLPPAMRPVMVGIAANEFRGRPIDTDATHINANGTTDYGAGQVNTVNMGWTGLANGDWRDPCQNLQAAMKVLFARYNGNAPDAAKATYASSAEAAVRAAGDAPHPENQKVDPKDPQPPEWDMEALADWRRRHDPSAEDAAQASTVNPSSLPVIASKDPK